MAKRARGDEEAVLGENTRSQARLTQRQLAAIASLLTSPTIRDAAEAAGVAESTLRKWRAMPAFQEALTSAFDDLWAGMTGRLQQRCATAIGTLETVCAFGDKDAAKVSAARSILEFAFKARSDMAIEARLAKLEQLFTEDDEE